jgi:GNAT superfamily N-acetyltransferase
MSKDELQVLRENYDVVDYTESKIPIPNKPESGLILLVGSSGSGKSTILNSWFKSEVIIFDDKSVIENFSSIDTGEKLLRATGLRSVPTWFRPFNTLSNGEAHRAYCAKCLDMGIAFIDEFTSVVDRDTAKSLSVSLRSHHQKGLLVVASCHRDIDEWLCPDEVYDTDRQEFIPRRFLRRPQLTVRINASSFKDWVLFQKHHYLSGDISKSTHCYTALLGNRPVGFLAVIHRCCRDIRSYWGESRLVVLPEFQGLGIGKALSESIGEEYISRGLRYFSKTSHPVLGEYRNNSAKWRGTSTNGVRRSSYLKKDGTARVQKGFGKTAKSIKRDAKRICFSHEYVGAEPINQAD